MKKAICMVSRNPDEGIDWARSLPSSPASLATAVSRRLSLTSSSPPGPDGVGDQRPVSWPRGDVARDCAELASAGPSPQSQAPPLLPSPRPRRRMSVSLSPNSLRAARRLITNRVVASAERPDAFASSDSRDATLAGGGGSIKRARGRSMSVVLPSKASLFAPSVSTGESPTGATTSSSPQSGFRQRLRQRTIGGLRRTGSMSPARLQARADRSEGNAAGPVGAEVETELPSLLDLVPRWKRSWVMRQAKERQAEFTTFGGVGIFCGTWNVNAKKPESRDPWWLHDWLCPKYEEGGVDGGGGGNDDGMEDLYAIGIQELVDLNAVNVTIDTRSQKMSAMWEKHVALTLNMAAIRARRAQSISTVPSSPPGPNTSAEEMLMPKELHFGSSRELAATGVTSPSPLANADVIDRRENENAQLSLAVAASGAAISGDDCPTTCPRSVGEQKDVGVAPVTVDVNKDFIDFRDNDDDEDIDHISDDDEKEAFLGGGGDGNGATSGGLAQETTGGVGREARAGQVGRGRGQARGRSTFVLVAKEHLVGTWLAVFIRTSMLSQVSDIRTGTVTAGMLGLMGNKGGVGVSFRLRNSSLCFISSHLAAHRDNVRSRNDNYFKILRAMLFPPLGTLKQQQQQQQQQQRQHPGTPPSSLPSPRSGRTRRATSMASSSSVNSSSSTFRYPQRSASPLSSPLLSPPSPSGPPSPLSTPPPLLLRVLPIVGGATLPVPTASWESGLTTNEIAGEASPSSFPAPSEVADTEINTGIDLKAAAAAAAAFAAVTKADGKQDNFRLLRGSSAHGCDGDGGGAEVGGSGVGTAMLPRTLTTTVDPQVGGMNDPQAGELSALGGGRGGGRGEVGEIRWRLDESNDDDMERLMSTAEGARRTREEEVAQGVRKEVEVVAFSAAAAAAAAAVAAAAEATEVGSRPTQLLKPPEMDNRDTVELGIQDHDVVFWLGDLNYRIDMSVPATEVLEHAQSGRLDILRAKDQLNSARAAGDAFEGFHEAFIDFLPTYKYTAGTDEYDTRPDKKFRAPAWCDRILFWTGGGSSTGGNVSQRDYRRSERPLTSDHKPVSGSFRFACKQVDPELYVKVLMELIEMASRNSEDRQAKIDVLGEGTSVAFGEVQYKVKQTRTLWIHNSGRVPAPFRVYSAQLSSVSAQRSSGSPPLEVSIREGDSHTRALSGFKQKECVCGDMGAGDGVSNAGSESGSPSRAMRASDECDNIGGSGCGGGGCGNGNIFDEGVGTGKGLGEGEFEERTGEEIGGLDQEKLPEWYTVIPNHGTLLPGEKMEIEFTVLVKDPTARALAAARCVPKRLEDMVVLRVDEGSDRYISVVGTYKPSVYGSSLEAMVAREVSASVQAPEDGDCCLAHTATSDSSGVGCVGRGVEQGKQGVSSKEYGGKKQEGEAKMEQGEKLPSQIWYMVDALVTRGGCQQPGLFSEKGVQQEIQGIREATDNEVPFPPHSAHSMVEALVGLLASLSPPVVPESACTAASEGFADGSDVKASVNILLDKLPVLHRTTFEYIVSFFRALLGQQADNGLTPLRLVLVLRSCLLPDGWRRRSYDAIELGLQYVLGGSSPAIVGGSGAAFSLQECRSSHERARGSGVRKVCRHKNIQEGHNGEGGGCHGVVGVGDSGRGDALDLIFHHLLTTNETVLCARMIHSGERMGV